MGIMSRIESVIPWVAPPTHEATAEAITVDSHCDGCGDRCAVKCVPAVVAFTTTFGAKTLTCGAGQ